MCVIPIKCPVMKDVMYLHMQINKETQCQELIVLVSASCQTKRNIKFVSSINPQILVEYCRPKQALSILFHHNLPASTGFIQVLQDKIQGLFQDFSRTTKIFFKYFYAQMTLLIFNVLTCVVGYRVGYSMGVPFFY